ncbi:MAG: phosphoribosyltransferase family protein [Aquificaceae bacterium]|nr:phosphoribosyltransferase family protein [Aquificaceae bacterium]MDW8422803.1 phosphoribosyltransferase family protein [Aquificaceae bacterium]
MIGLLQLLGLAQNRCRACNAFFLGQEQGFICSQCLGSLKPYHPMDYSQRIEYVFSYRVFGLYDGILKEVIHCIKFHNSKALAHRLGSTIKNHLWEYIREVEPDIITFPSLNIRRFWLRGFNHIEHILTGAEIPCMKVFKRLDLNPPLSTLKKEERERAVLGHRLREEFIDYIEGKRVLVVDDLLTTGSTVRRLAYLLLSVGASEVHAYFVARG